MFLQMNPICLKRGRNLWNCLAAKPCETRGFTNMNDCPAACCFTLNILCFCRWIFERYTVYGDSTWSMVDNYDCGSGNPLPRCPGTLPILSDHCIHDHMWIFHQQAGRPRIFFTVDLWGSNLNSIWIRVEMSTSGNRCIMMYLVHMLLALLNFTGMLLGDASFELKMSQVADVASPSQRWNRYPWITHMLLRRLRSQQLNLWKSFDSTTADGEDP